jgi:hypothetical protein
MSTFTPASDYHRMTYKDLMSLMAIEETLAKRYLTDIKKHYEISIVLFKHFRNYFKV